MPRFTIFEPNNRSKEMLIKEITSATAELREAVNRLLSQLTTTPKEISKVELDALVDSRNSHLFIAMDTGGTVGGMITVGTYRAPTGLKGWIEDVVVDEAFRGRGLGKRLTLHAIEYAKNHGVELLSLTSNPARVAANKLYPETGFRLKETNVYVMALKKHN